MQLLRCFKTTALGCWGNKTILLILLLVQIHVNGSTAERTCHQCRGINCQRTSYAATEKCANDLDICVTVFNGQTIQAQGCLEQLSQDLRSKCNSLDSEQLGECHKCNRDLCNNLASSSFECIQCDSDTDANCLSNPSSLNPSRCLISRTPNEYCFVKQDGNRVVRGCSSTLEEQKNCLSSEGCMICQPSELSGCNSVTLKANDPSDGGSGSGDGGTGSGGSGSGSGDGGSGSGSGNGGSGSGDGGSGGGSGSGDGGSGSGSGNGGNENGGNGSGDGDSGSGSGDGGAGGGGNGTNVLKTNIVFLILNIIFVYLLRK